MLNEKYEQVAVHKREYGHGIQPVINFENYVGSLSRKPRAFLNSPYFLTMPEPMQNHLKNCQYADLKQMLLELVPIIRDGKIGDASAVLELSTIRNTDDFTIAYRALTEDTRPLPSVTTPLTPVQQPYLPKLDKYSALIGADRSADAELLAHVGYIHKQQAQLATSATSATSATGGEAR